LVAILVIDILIYKKNMQNRKYLKLFNITKKR
jgi:hypothetical protein